MEKNSFIFSPFFATFQKWRQKIFAASCTLLLSSSFAYSSFCFILFYFKFYSKYSTAGSFLNIFLFFRRERKIDSVTKIWLKIEIPENFPNCAAENKAICKFLRTQIISPYSFATFREIFAWIFRNEILHILLALIWPGGAGLHQRPGGDVWGGGDPGGEHRGKDQAGLGAGCATAQGYQRVFFRRKASHGLVLFIQAMKID